MHAAPQLYSSMQIEFSLLFKIMLYQCLFHTPEALLEAFGGHTWVFDWVWSGTSHRRTFWTCLQFRGKQLSLGGSVEPLSPATARLPSCSTAHWLHLKGHWEWKHRENVKVWSCLMKEWKLNLTWGSRGLFLEQLWSAEAAHGGGCDNRAPVNWEAELSVWRGCSSTLRGESWQPKPLMPSLLHCILDWQIVGAEGAGRKIMFWKGHERKFNFCQRIVQIISVYVSADNCTNTFVMRKKKSIFTLLCLARQAGAELRVWGQGRVRVEGVTWPH